MPRVGRRKSERGINRQTIFEEDDDSEKFLLTLKTHQEKSGYKIYGYCLMGDHIHLLIKEEKEDLGIIMRRIGASCVYWYNMKYNRFGHLFQDRYKSEVVDDDRCFLTVLRYIHQNPVKAGMVSNVGNYKWSSYSEYIGQKDIIDTDFALDIFSTDREKAMQRFNVVQQFIFTRNDEKTAK